MIKNFKIFFLTFLIFNFAFLIFAPNVLAQPELGLGYGELTGLGAKDIRETIASVINVALGFLGIIAVIIILLGGFSWMTSGGNEEKVAKAKKLIIAGVIGLAIILSAYVIAQFVILSLIEATTQR